MPPQQPTLNQQAELLAQLLAEVAGDPNRFVVYENDPIGFCKDVLGMRRKPDWPTKYFPDDCSLWTKQQEILKAAVSKRRIAVRSGHGIGKTYGLAALVIWWLYARRGLVVTTAPTWESVAGVLWREINSMVKLAVLPLPRQKQELQTELRVDGTWYAIGLSTNQVEAFTGRHHPRLLVVVDEAPGVPEPNHLAIATLATGSKNCIVMIGNPTSLSGTFYEAFKHPEIWYPIKVSCLDHPNVLEGVEIIEGAATTGWIEERRALWGPNHPFWAPRVLGEFPRITTRGVVPLEWIERATDYEQWQMALKEAETANLPRIGGLDVARYGENVCVLTIRRGDAVESVEAWSHLNLMETAGRAAKAIRDLKLKTLVVDSVGIGAGVVDRLSEEALPVYAYNGGHRAFTPATFTNRRTEMWWHLRERLEKKRLWLPSGLERLTADLVAPEYTTTGAGRIKVQSKEDLLDAGFRSPDYADSLVLCFAMDLDPLADAPFRAVAGQDPEQFIEIDPTKEPWGQLPMGW